MRTAADLARTIEPKCVSMTEDKVASFASPSAVDSVEPAYTFVPSTASNHEARLRGALIHLRPVTSVSREAMVRGLECHEARVALAKAPPFANDPYVLPDHWLTIEIDSEGDAFAVRILADTFEDAKRVLARAKLYVASRPSEVVTVPASASPAEQPKVSLPASGPPPSDPALSQPASTAK
jgi:hypothetical protein